MNAKLPIQSGSPERLGTPVGSSNASTDTSPQPLSTPHNTRHTPPNVADHVGRNPSSPGQSDNQILDTNHQAVSDINALIRRNKRRTYFTLGFISLAIILFGWLLKKDLDWQHHMLQASGLSFQQRIFLERVGDQLFLLQEIHALNPQDRNLEQIRADITTNLDQIQANQAQLATLLTYSPKLFGSNLLAPSDQLSASHADISAHLVPFYQRAQQLLNTHPELLAASNSYWQPDDLITATNTPLMRSMDAFSLAVYDASLKLNRQLLILYASLFVSMILGIWLVWYWLLHPLNRHLMQNHQKIERINANLLYQSQHDSLTQLPNRSAFYHRLETLAKQPSFATHTALFLIDIDHFKSINDNFGHQVGDDVLRRIATFLSSLNKGEAYRISGDEFTYLYHTNSRAELTRLAESIQNGANQLYAGADKRLRINVTIGVAWGNQSGRTPHEKFSAADIALFKAKEAGRGRYLLFNDISDAPVSDMLELENAFMKAIENQEIVVYYQPLVDAKTGLFLGLEALARWQHPEKGLLLPGQWLHLADRFSIDHIISKIVLDIAHRDMQQWRRQGIDVGTVHINLPESLLSHEHIEQYLMPFLDTQTGDTERCWLGIEIPENVLLDRSLATISQHIKRLQALGITISLDDFGTGFTNLSHLRRIPFDVIKLDHSFTQKILDDPGMLTIVRALIEIANGLDKKLVFEGVETPEIRDALLALGGRYFQGFLYARPVPATAIGTFFSQQSPNQPE